jgi:hypothetical protein
MTLDSFMDICVKLLVTTLAMSVTVLVWFIVLTLIVYGAVNLVHRTLMLWHELRAERLDKQREQLRAKYMEPRT